MIERGAASSEEEGGLSARTSDSDHPCFDPEAERAAAEALQSDDPGSEAGSDHPVDRGALQDSPPAGEGLVGRAMASVSAAPQSGQEEHGESDVSSDPLADVEYEVEEIRDHRDCQPANRPGLRPRPLSEREYLVKWVGYDAGRCIWVPASQLRGCQDLVTAYVARARLAGSWAPGDRSS